MVFKKYGLGLTTENNFKKIYGINLKTKVFLKQNIKNTFKNINSSIPVELVLFNKIKKNILFYKTIKNFRGTRHWRGLPVRGQRTHTNATKPKFVAKFLFK